MSEMVMSSHETMTTPQVFQFFMTVSLSFPDLSVTWDVIVRCGDT